MWADHAVRYLLTNSQPLVGDGLNVDPSANRLQQAPEAMDSHGSGLLHLPDVASCTASVSSSMLQQASGMQLGFHVLRVL